MKIINKSKITNFLNFNLKLIVLSSLLFSQLSLSEIFLYQNDPDTSSINMAKANTSDTWYNTSYLYRKEISIAGGSIDLSDYQIKLNISYETGKMNADFSDLRFVGLDGSTVYNYYIESKTDSVSAVVWAKISFIPASWTYIYMYYGNRDTTSLSDKDSTLEKWIQTTDAEFGGGLSTAALLSGDSILLKQTYQNISWQEEVGWEISGYGNVKPALGDLDGDGDLDLMIGDASGVTYGYKNTSTTSNPVWTAEASWNAPDIGANASPALGDLDGDGDLDLMIGERYGSTFGYKNTNTTSNPVWAVTASWNIADIGTNASPTLGDLDGDGDLDLMIGESSGTTFGYKNTSTTSNPVWTAEASWNAPDIGSYSVPCLGDLDNDGDLDIMLSEYGGSTYGYKNTNTTLAPIWTAQASWNIGDVGRNAACSLGDLDNDNDLDILVGNEYAYTYAYKDLASLGYSAGSFISSPFDSASLVKPQSISFNATIPANTSIKFQLATSDNNSIWNFTGPDGTNGTYYQTNGGFSEPSLNNKRYVKYAVYLQTTDSGTAPSLQDVSIYYAKSATVEPISSLGTEESRATSYALTLPAPASGPINVPSQNFTITPNGIYTGTITITPSGGGLLNVITKTFTNSSTPQTFTITPTTGGTVTLTLTNSGGFTNPSPVTYTAISTSSSPSSIVQGSTGNNIVITGIGTSWTAGTPGVPTFTLSGGTGASITNQTITDPTHATLTLNAGSAAGNLTITDPSTGATTIVAVVPSTANQITSFNLTVPAATGIINDTTHTVYLTVPYGTNVTSLTPTITTSTGATISPTSGTSHNFTSPSTYTVTAQDGTTTQNYTVTVNISPSTAVGYISSNQPIVLLQNGRIDISNLPSDIIQIAISRTPDFKDVSWEVFSNEEIKQLNYCPDTLYIKFRNKSGAVSDVIIYVPKTNNDTNLSNLQDGDIVKTINNPDVYIIKIKNNKQYKRLILSPSVFQSYGHLKWSNLKIISQTELDQYTTSNLVKETTDTIIYELFPNGDTGERRAFDMGKTYDTDSVYEINKMDRDSYELIK